jgi:hypothetical protein
VADSLNFATAIDPAEVANNLLLNGFEVRTYTEVLD